MNYVCTRNILGGTVSSAEAIKLGISPDGGLFMPNSLPKITRYDIERLSKLPYHERARYVLAFFLTDFPHAVLDEICREAYSPAAFGKNPAPVVKLGENRAVLELFHGPTCAFKDMALQIMPKLFLRSLELTGDFRRVHILAATSGDTGKAALEGYKNIPGIEISVFYPADGVSRVQQLQMTTQEGKNAHVVAVDGNFDDCQNAVKSLFADTELSRELDRRNTFLSSANSINWGRLAPQIAYYVSAYADMVASGMIKLGDKIDVVVPTGNFGNIFAAYLALRMDLPIRRLVCASNINNVLTEFFATGTYDRNREFHTTMSPSMDILISSNLERLLFIVAGPRETAGYMKALAQDGCYSVSEEIRRELAEYFAAEYVSEEQTSKKIAEVWRKFGYLADPHTAVALGAADMQNDGTPQLVVATASAYKFAADVYFSLTNERLEDIEAIYSLSNFTKTAVPAPLNGIERREIRFNKKVGGVDEIRDLLL